MDRCNVYDRRIRPQERRMLDRLQAHIENTVFAALADNVDVPDSALVPAQLAAGRAVRAVLTRNLLNRPLIREARIRSR